MDSRKNINYIEGDATQPLVAGPLIIAHVVNDQGAWGKGFTASIDKRWSKPGFWYRKWARSPTNGYLPHESQFRLGNIRNTQVYGDLGTEKDPIWVCHMVAQQGLPGKNNPRPLRYDALGHCLWKVAENAKYVNATVHMPRIGCGLAKGDWAVVEQLVTDAFCREGIRVYVYDPEE